MPLQRDPITGKISRNIDGKLACSPNDCCEGEPCPPCCLRITSGALIDGEIKIFISEAVVDAGVDKIASMEITITTESGTRQVCHGETITINVESFLDGMSSSVAPIEIITDPIWEITNAPGADSHQERPGGWAVWTEEPEVEADLELNACFFNASDVAHSYGGLGSIFVRIGNANYSISDVVHISRCQPTVACCTRVIECEPCCLTMPHQPETGVVTPLWTWSEKRQRFERLYHLCPYQFTIAGVDPGGTPITTTEYFTVWVVIWISGESTNGNETVFCPDQPMRMGADIGYQESQFSEGFNFTVVFNLCAFEFLDTEAGPEPDIETDPELSVTWTEGEDLEYAIKFTHNCEFPGIVTDQEPDCLITFGVIVGGTNIVGGNVFCSPAEGSPFLQLEQCEKVLIGGCLCGCPCCGPGFFPDELVLEWDYAPIDPATFEPGPMQHYEVVLARVTEDAGEPIVDPCELDVRYDSGELPYDTYFAVWGLASGSCGESQVLRVRAEHQCEGGPGSVGWRVFFEQGVSENPLTPGHVFKCQLPISFKSEAGDGLCSEFFYTLREA